MGERRNSIFIFILHISSTPAYAKHIKASKKRRKAVNRRIKVIKARIYVRWET